jgi:hypothetical protein
MRNKGHGIQKETESQLVPKKKPVLSVLLAVGHCKNRDPTNNSNVGYLSSKG